MAHIVDPYNLDTGDDAVFSALLSQGLVWVEDDDDYDTAVDLTVRVLEEAHDFIYVHSEKWVNFSLLCQYLHKTFGKRDLKRLGEPNKKYKSLVKFFEDYSSDFVLRQDDEKNGLYWICLEQTY